MAMEKVSQCPRCSAPMYLPPESEWNNGIPPKVTYTCECIAASIETMRRAQSIPAGFPPASPTRPVG